MQKKSSVAPIDKHPRIPPEHSGIQVNFCKPPACRNYGVPPEQTSVRGKNSYALESRNAGISGCLCTACGEEFPLKSNLGIRRLYLGVDRQDYLVNWLVRKDKRNIQLSAIAAVDNEHSYCFGVHLNFGPGLDSRDIQAEAEKNGDLNLPYPHRRFARLWPNADHARASAKPLVEERRSLDLPGATR